MFFFPPNPPKRGYASLKLSLNLPHLKGGGWEKIYKR
jgi:hypothetical protein